MRVRWANADYVLAFRHETEQVVVVVGSEPAGGGMRDVTRQVPNPVLDNVHLDGVRTRRAKRAVTAMVKVLPSVSADTGAPARAEVLARATAVCSRREKTDSPEFGRQLALARLLVQVNRSLGALLLGAYMSSARRPVCDLRAAVVRNPTDGARLAISRVGDVLRV